MGWEPLRSQFSAHHSPLQLLQEWVPQSTQAPGESCPSSLGMGNAKSPGHGGQGARGIWALRCSSHPCPCGCAVSSHGQKQGNTQDSVCGCCWGEQLYFCTGNVISVLPNLQRQSCLSFSNNKPKHVLHIIYPRILCFLLLFKK